MFQEQQDIVEPGLEPPTFRRELLEALSRLGVSNTCAHQPARFFQG